MSVTIEELAEKVTELSAQVVLLTAILEMRAEFTDEALDKARALASWKDHYGCIGLPKIPSNVDKELGNFVKVLKVMAKRPQ